MTEEPGGLQSMGLKRVGHNLCDQHTEQLLVISAAVGWGGALLESWGGGSGMLPSLLQCTRPLSSQALVYVDLLRTTSVSSLPYPR